MTHDELHLLSDSALRAEIARHKWYHGFRFRPGVETPDIFPGPIGLVAAGMERHRDLFKGAAVLDIGARDCQHALRAEEFGARRVVAIDSDLSSAARDVVLPWFNSRIELRHQNLFALRPEHEEPFDVVLFPGVLYHLRHPELGLMRAIDVCRVCGHVLIETALWVPREAACRDMPLNFMPTPEESPYEGSSVSFLNLRGLDSVMHSFGCARISEPMYAEVPPIARAFLAYRFENPKRHSYWSCDGDAHHTYHSRAAHGRANWGTE